MFFIDGWVETSPLIPGLCVSPAWQELRSRKASGDLESDESLPVSAVRSTTLSVSGRPSPCRRLLAPRSARDRSARRLPPCGSCGPEVLVGGRPEHEH